MVNFITETSMVDSNSEVNMDGVFKVDETGEITIDYLFDGGFYQGEVGLFSLDNLNINDLTSESFEEEAINRAQSNSPQGHIVIKDAQEQAKFSTKLEWEGNFNEGVYPGRKTFQMNPGDNLGIVFVPNGTLNEVLTSEDSIGSKNIFFSIPSANNNGNAQFASVTTTEEKTIIGLEDTGANSQSSNDYNDVILGIKGVKPIGFEAIANVIRDDKNWLETELGEEILQYTEDIYGGSGNDILVGHDDDDILNGGEGDDFFDGGNGNDTFHGGTGNDTIWGWTGNDLINGGEGDDTLVGHDDDDILNGEEGNDFFNGGNGNDTFRGGTGNDTIWGWTGDDLINGDAGNDILVGHDDDDILNGGEGDDFFDGGNGDDTFNGGTGNDTVWGWTGDDLINGSEGDDQLFGHQNNDTLNGGEGNDYLNGGEGNDIFVLELDQGRDIIVDYVDGVDKFGLGTSLNFEDLNIIQSANHVVIKDLADNEITLIREVTTNEITEDDFI